MTRRMGKGEQLRVDSYRFLQGQEKCLRFIFGEERQNTVQGCGRF